MTPQIYMYFWQTTFSILSLNIGTAYWTPSLTRSYISSNNHNWFERAQFQIEVIEQIFNSISFFQLNLSIHFTNQHLRDYRLLHRCSSPSPRTRGQNQEGITLAKAAEKHSHLLILHSMWRLCLEPWVSSNCTNTEGLCKVLSIKTRNKERTAYLICCKQAFSTCLCECLNFSSHNCTDNFFS